MTTDEAASASSPALSPTPQLNFACLEVVLRYVDDHRTLFACLTLSKDVFRIAVKKLYASLFTFKHQSKKSVERCLHLIASVSPYKNDSIVQALENAYGLTKRTIEPGTQPYADYLSFVHDLSFVIPAVDIILLMPPSYNSVRLLEPSNLKGPIAWAIGGHRLSEIEVLSLSGVTDVRFVNRVKQLTALKRIVIHPSSMGSWHSVHTFVQRYVAAHGEAGRRLVLDVRDNSVLPSQMAQTFALLCPPRGERAAPYQLDTFNLAPYAGHIDTVDFGAVKRVAILLTSKEDTRLWAKVLPKCTNLETLSVNTVDKGYHQQLRPVGAVYAWASNILDWPVMVSAPLIPLKKLDIRRLDSRGQAFVNAALERFAWTLETVNIDTVDGHISYSRSCFPPKPRHADILSYRIANIPGLEFPNLRRLSVNAYHPLDISLDPRCLPVMPRLEELSLVQNDKQAYDIRERRTNSTVVPSDETSWPSGYQLPNLRHLRMMGLFTLEFHPDCLRFMPLLEKLTLEWVPKHNEGQAATGWLNQELWTWNDADEGWVFPALKCFKVSGSMLSMFKWPVLRRMPKLRELTLSHYQSVQTLMTLLDGLHRYDDNNDNSDNSHSSSNSTASTHPSLESLTITVGGNLSFDHWNVLLGGDTTTFNFPGLKKLTLFSFQGRFDDAVIRSVAARHPALENLEIMRSSTYFYWDEGYHYRLATYGSDNSYGSRFRSYADDQTRRDDLETMQSGNVDESILKSLPRADVLAVNLDRNRFWVLKVGKKM